MADAQEASEIMSRPGTVDLQTAEAAADDVRGLRWELTPEEREEFCETVVEALRSISRRRQRRP